MKKSWWFDASNILNISLFPMSWIISAECQSITKNMLGKADRGIVIRKQLKSLFLANFQEYACSKDDFSRNHWICPLNFILTRSSHDILSHQQWDHIPKMCLLNALNIMITRDGIEIPEICKRFSFFWDQIVSATMVWGTLSQTRSSHLASLITFRSKHRNKNKFHLNSMHSFIFFLLQYTSL